jgi:hypothetical protein
MYISRVRLKNIRTFEYAEFDFTNESGSLRRFALILGDNSAGKTTVLRSIAIGLCDPAGAAALLNELWGDFMRDSTKTSEIMVEFRETVTSKKKYSLTTSIKTSRSDNYDIEQVEYPRGKFPWKNLFACGYGSSRGTRGQYDYDEYAIVDAIYTLFNYDSPLQQAELALRRQIRTKRDERRLCRFLESLLLLEQGVIRLSEKGIMIEGSDGTERHIATVGDGYQGTITWVADLMGWALLAKRTKDAQKLVGIVIIDEIEQHLHPKLQREIISRLRKMFPNMQFIATTHSPLCAAGISDIAERDGYLALLKLDNGSARTSVQLSPMPGWRYDRILTSEAFDLPVARDITTEAILNRVQRSYTPGPSKAQSKEYKNAIRELKAHSISAAETERERVQQELLTNEIRKLKTSLNI